jgi:hypothetical protein
MASGYFVNQAFGFSMVGDAQVMHRDGTIYGATSVSLYGESPTGAAYRIVP